MNLIFILTCLTSSLQFLIVDIKLFWQTGPATKNMCSYNNSIPINIPSHPYVLLNRSILCNCDVEADSNFLLELLAACKNSETELVMYFTVNLAFVNYFDNLVESLDVPILKNWTTQEQLLPISLEAFEINSSLLSAPKC